jgi:hypothetical protein
MRIDFKDDLLAELAKLHEYREEFEQALADGRLLFWNGGELLINHWRAGSLTIVVREIVSSQMNGFQNMSLIVKPKPDYMYNTRTAERVEVPDRFHEEPEEGEAYWLEGRGRGDISRKSTWGGKRQEKALLASGLLHKTRESAEIARKARFDHE